MYLLTFFFFFSSNLSFEGYENEKPASSRARYAEDSDKYEAKKADRFSGADKYATKAKEPTLASDSDDEYLFNRKKFLNTKSHQPDSSRPKTDRSFTPIKEFESRGNHNTRNNNNINNNNGAVSNRAGNVVSKIRLFYY